MCWLVAIVIQSCALWLSCQEYSCRYLGRLPPADCGWCWWKMAAGVGKGSVKETGWVMEQAAFLSGQTSYSQAPRRIRFTPMVFGPRSTPSFDQNSQVLFLHRSRSFLHFGSSGWQVRWGTVLNLVSWCSTQTDFSVVLGSWCVSEIGPRSACIPQFFVQRPVCSRSHQTNFGQFFLPCWI